MLRTYSWRPGKKFFYGNYMINAGVNLDLTVNAFGLHNLNDPFAVEKQCKSLKRF